jgi:serine/threonine-protein kinase
VTTLRAIFIRLALTPLLIAGHASAQSADPEQADALFQEGRALLKAGKPDQACPKFLESQRLDPATGTLLAVAACHEQQGRLATAWVEFTQVVERARAEGRSDRANLATARAQALRPRLSTLTVELAPELRALRGVTILHNGEAFTESVWDRVLPVDGGEHVFELSASGHAPSRRTVNVLSEGDEATIRLPALRREPSNSGTDAPVPSDDAAGSRASSAGRTPTAEAATQHASKLTALQGVGIGAAVAGLGTAVAGGVFFVLAQNKMSDSKRYCTGDRCYPEGLELRASAVGSGDRATVLGIGGAVLAVTGIACYALGRSTESDTPQASLSAVAGPGGASARLELGF